MRLLKLGLGCFLGVLFVLVLSACGDRVYSGWEWNAAITSALSDKDDNKETQEPQGKAKSEVVPPSREFVLKRREAIKKDKRIKAALQISLKDRAKKEPEFLKILTRYRAAQKKVTEAIRAKAKPQTIAPLMKAFQTEGNAVLNALVPTMKGLGIRELRFSEATPKGAMLRFDFWTSNKVLLPYVGILVLVESEKDGKVTGYRLFEVRYVDPDIHQRRPARRKGEGTGSK